MLDGDRAYRELLAALAEQLRAGLPVREALRTLSTRSRVGAWASSAERAIGQGASLSDALRAAGDVAPPDHLVVIAAGERSGRLVEVLDALRARLEAAAESRRRLLRRLAYPILIYCLLFTLVPVFLLVSGRPLAYFGVVLLGLGPPALALIAWMGRRSLAPPGSALRSGVQSIALSLPVLGRALRDRALSQTLSLLALLIESGLGWEESLEAAGGATGWSFIDQDLPVVARWIRGGSKAAEAFGKLRGLDGETLAAIAAGEVAGSIDGALDRAAESLLRGSDVRFAALTGALPVVVIVLVGAGVLIAAVQVLRAFYSAAGL